MPTQIKINLCFNSVLGMTLNYIRWGSFGSGTECVTPYPHCTQVHFGPEWCNLLGPQLRELLGRQVLEALVWIPFQVSINTASKPRPRKQPHITKHVIFHAGKNLATWGRIQRDESWWWSASHEDCHLLLSYWNPFCPSSRKATATQQIRHFSGGQKPSLPRSHSTRRKMTMIYFKKRVSSFADSLKSLYAMSSRGLQNEINGFLNCLEKVISSCRIHLRIYSNGGERTTGSDSVGEYKTGNWQK